jgi:ribosomal protein L37AE/L43A
MNWQDIIKFQWEKNFLCPKCKRGTLKYKGENTVECPKCGFTGRV